MAERRLTKTRKALLIELELIIGNLCYNANTQNRGPGGILESEGREFRYPITFRENDGRKTRKYRVDKDIHSDTILTGYYAFGANQLHIMKGLDEVLDHLESLYALKI